MIITQALEIHYKHQPERIPAKCKKIKTENLVTISLPQQNQSIPSNTRSCKYIKRIKIYSKLNVQYRLNPEKENSVLTIIHHFYKTRANTHVNRYLTQQIIVDSQNFNIALPYNQFRQKIKSTLLQHRMIQTALDIFTFVAPASRLLKTSSSTTLVRSKRIIPERTELRTASGRGLMLLIENQAEFTKQLQSLQN